jgi:hypothetical protein
MAGVLLSFRYRRPAVDSVSFCALLFALLATLSFCSLPWIRFPVDALVLTAAAIGHCRLGFIKLSLKPTGSEV